MRAALRFLLRQENTSHAARLGLAASRFWRMRGHFTEGRQWLQEILAIGIEDSRLRAKLLCRAGSMASRI